MDKETKLKIEQETICEECGNELPEPIVETREGGYSELVTYCICGAVYTD